MSKLQQISVKSQINEIHKVLDFIEIICDEHNIYNSYYGHIVTSITEAFNNAVEHGNKFDENKSVTVSFEPMNDGLTFSVEDEGKGFNPTKISDPTDSNNDGEAGRGIFLMSCLSNKLIFENGGSKICFKFLISSINKDISERRVEKYRKFIEQFIHTEITN